MSAVTKGAKPGSEEHDRAAWAASQIEIELRRHGYRGEEIVAARCFRWRYVRSRRGERDRIRGAMGPCR